MQQVEINLQDSFKDKNENRVLDIWVDLPPQLINQYMDRHLGRMDQDIRRIENALKSRDKLARCIETMEQLARVPIKLITNAPKRHRDYVMSQPIEVLRTMTVPKKPEPRVTNNKSDD